MSKASSIAFVLITCKQESVSYIASHLKDIESVKEITPVDGPWRIIAKLESDDMDHIRETIRWKLRKIPEIESTLTLVEYMK